MKNTNHFKQGLVLFALIAISLACSGGVTFFPTPVPGEVETVVASTLAVYTASAPTFTSVPITNITEEIPTTEPAGEVFVYTVVENVNLRTQPGMLFQVSRVMAKDTRLRLLGRAPGGEWLNVMNDELVVGWVNVNTVTGVNNSSLPPVIQPTDAILVTGKVLAPSGSPVSGIGFAITQGSRRTDATTDVTGQFYAYLPRSMSGTWTVAYESIACTSNIMDANCVCLNNVCGGASPASLEITLPSSSVLNFVWK